MQNDDRPFFFFLICFFAILSSPACFAATGRHLHVFGHCQSDSLVEATNDRSVAEAYMRHLQVSDGIQVLTLGKVSLSAAAPK